MNRDKIALAAVVAFVLVPLLATVAILGWFLIPQVDERAGDALLLLAPGLVVFFGGLVLGLVNWRDPARRLFAIRVRAVGRILFFLVPDLWFAWALLTGQVSPAAWPALIILTGSAALQVVVLTGIRTPAPPRGTA